MANDLENSTKPSRISQWLLNTNPTYFSAYCIIAAFGTYFCMYAFRKPFTAGTFENMAYWGIGFKTILVSSQVGGYTLSKFIGIKVISELSPKYRAGAILLLIAIAEVALFLFAVSPAPWSMVWLFVNGLPLGMVFGLVIGFLEGRKVTEALSAGLCASFIVASGVVKSTGRRLIEDYFVSEFWMPFITGLIFVVPLLICVWLLSQIPPPTKSDQDLRTKRTTMNRAERKAFFRRHAFGLCGLLLIYILLTIVRSLRDDFGVEIWRELGVAGKPEVFAKSEFWVMVGVVTINGLAIMIKNNRKAMLASIGMLCFGFLIVLGSLAAQRTGVVSPMFFMVTLGLGLYVPYVAFHTTVFERLIAAFRESGTLGYLMCLADAVGYLVYVAMMIFRNSTSGEVDFLSLLIWATTMVAILSMLIAIVLAVHYFRTIPRSTPQSADDNI